MVHCKDQTAVLEKGLNFVPAPRNMNNNSLLAASSKFTRLVKLRSFFGPTDNYVKKSNFQHPSTFTPAISLLPSNIQDFSAELETLASTFPNYAPRDNLTHNERLALTSLKKYPNILFRKADKGSCTVVMNRDQYINEAESQLSNPRFYRKLPTDHNLDSQARTIIQAQLLSLHNKRCISPKEYSYLYDSTLSTTKRTLYFVPKIHKDLVSWPNPNCPPSRPIISDVGSPTYIVGKFISSKLREISTLHDSYIKDTYDFISQLRSHQFPADVALVTIDVQSLYTNIDTDSGLKAVFETMLRHPDPSRPDFEILKLLETCLKFNTFVFNGDDYLQTNGAAMGHSYSVDYANIKMANWEIGALTKCPLKPLLYRRFIDDIILLWSHGFVNFLTFFNILNSHDPSIKLTYSYSTQSVNFLDIEIYKGLQFQQFGILDTRVFFKPTDSHALLHKHSFHPKHTFFGIVKSQVLRFFRICSNSFDFDISCSILFDSLTKRGYARRDLRRLKSEVKNGYPLSKTTHKIGSATPCNGPRCQKCQHLLPGNHVLVNNNPMTITDNFNCDSSDVIYVIKCIKCDVCYIGETGTPIRTRINNHLSSIYRHDQYLPVAKHFTATPHSISEHFRFTPICREQNTRFRKHKEAQLIHKFNTTYPNGMNERSGNTNRIAVILPLVVPFSPNNAKFCSEVKTLAERHNVTDRIVPAYTKHKNLKSLLCRK